MKKPTLAGVIIASIFFVTVCFVLGSLAVKWIMYLSNALNG